MITNIQTVSQVLWCKMVNRPRYTMRIVRGEESLYCREATAEDERTADRVTRGSLAFAPVLLVRKGGEITVLGLGRLETLTRSGNYGGFGFFPNP